MDANCSGVFRHRSASPSSPLDTAVSEEVRSGTEAEREAQRPLPGSTGRRHTLAEVSTLSPCATPCKCRGAGAWPLSGVIVRAGAKRTCSAYPPLVVTFPRSAIGLTPKATRVTRRHFCGGLVVGTVCQEGRSSSWAPLCPGSAPGSAAADCQASPVPVASGRHRLPHPQHSYLPPSAGREGCLGGLVSLQWVCRGARAGSSPVKTGGALGCVGCGEHGEPPSRTPLSICRYRHLLLPNESFRRHQL